MLVAFGSCLATSLAAVGHLQCPPLAAQRLRSLACSKLRFQHIRLARRHGEDYTSSVTHQYCCCCTTHSSLSQCHQQHAAHSVNRSLPAFPEEQLYQILSHAQPVQANSPKLSH